MATGERHRLLEQRLPFLLPELDVALYRRLIRAYYGFYLPLEQRLLAADALPVERRKVPALLRDLRALAIKPESIELCADLPAMEDPMQVQGVLYVIEGATLGGQILRRIVAERLTIHADSGGAFLDVYGSANGALWKAFLKSLSRVETPEHCAQVADAALATFLCFERWLERAEVLR